MKKTLMIVSAALLSVGLIPSTVQAQETQCREFTRDVTIDGQDVQAYGTACLQPDGTWRIVADQPQGRVVQRAPDTREIIVFSQPRQKAYHHRSYSYRPYYSAGYGRSYGKKHYGYGYGHKSYGKKYGHGYGHHGGHGGYKKHH